MENVIDILARNIKITMRLRGYKQKDLCEFLQIKQSTVSNWYNGKAIMGIDTLVSICRFLDVTPNQILGIEALNDSDLLPAEKSLIEIRRNLNTFGQTTLDATAQAYSINPSMSVESEKESRAM